MRFIHTGDWHLGRLFHNLHLTPDQRFTLEGLLRLVEERQADALVIAGDVYDRAVPPPEAVSLLDDVLADCALRLNVPVVMIAGNHDSPVRLQYLGGLVGRVGVHVVGQVGAQPREVRITGRDGVTVAFWPLAYTDPETARCELSRDDIHTHAAALAAQIALVEAAMDSSLANVLVGHAWVTGATTSESERPLTVGGTGEVPASLFEPFAYTALGHLHRPQSVGAGVRYAGSLLKYSFDEADHRKSVSVVDVGADGAVTVEEVPLPVRHDLVRLRGSFDELMSARAGGNAEAYVEVVLVDSETVLDPMEKLRAVYPNILSLSRESTTAPEYVGQVARARSRSTAELFGEFFEDMTGAPMDDAQSAELAAVLDGIERGGREVAS
jgi:DNA repair protein SbcD/Mre11